MYTTHVQGLLLSTGEQELLLTTGVNPSRITLRRITVKPLPYCSLTPLSQQRSSMGRKSLNYKQSYISPESSKALARPGVLLPHREVPPCCKELGEAPCLSQLSGHICASVPALVPRQTGSCDFSQHLSPAFCCSTSFLRTFSVLRLQVHRVQLIPVTSSPSAQQSLHVALPTGARPPPQALMGKTHL